MDNKTERILHAALVVLDLDPHVWFHNASSFTCEEADAIAELLRAGHGDELADKFIAEHALSDEEGDTHFEHQVEATTNG